MIKKRVNQSSIKLTVLVLLGTLLVGSCFIKPEKNNGRKLALLKKDYKVDTIYIKTDSLIIRDKRIEKELDYVILKASQIGLKIGAFKPFFGIYMQASKDENLEIFCTDDLEYLDNQIFVDLGHRMPIRGGFAYKGYYFSVFETENKGLFDLIFSESESLVNIPFYKLFNKKTNIRTVFFTKDITFHFHVDENSINLIKIRTHN